MPYRAAPRRAEVRPSIRPVMASKRVGPLRSVPRSRGPRAAAGPARRPCFAPNRVGIVEPPPSTPSFTGVERTGIFPFDLQPRLDRRRWQNRYFYRALRQTSEVQFNQCNDSNNDMIDDAILINLLA